MENETTESPVPDPEEYIFFDSNSRYLTEDDVAGMDAADVRLAINEIYARRGRAFQTEDLNEYFSAKSWYKPQYSQEEFAAIEDQVFNDYEKENISFLGMVRDSLNNQDASFTPGYIYGTYSMSLDAGEITLEIGYYTDSGDEYVLLNGSYGDSAGYFEGLIVSSNGNSYTAVDDLDNIVDLTYDGLDSIEITSATNPGGMNFPGFEGTYQKTSEF